MIDNVIHFNFGLIEQKEEFLFCYYLAVFSAYLINSPSKIVFKYHFKPHGIWWDKLLCIPYLEIVHIDIPTHFGKKAILKTAHASDYVRMHTLYDEGGIYLDIDTICVKPYTHLLKHDMVLGKQTNHEICNAVMFSSKHNTFMNIWLNSYEKHFNSHGWGESSLSLPYNLYLNNKNLIHLKDKEHFFVPSWAEVDKIFVKKNAKIDDKLLILHYWESFSLKYMKNIKGWEWCSNNKHTLFGQLMLNIMKHPNFYK